MKLNNFGYKIALKADDCYSHQTPHLKKTHEKFFVSLRGALFENKWNVLSLLFSKMD